MYPSSHVLKVFFIFPAIILNKEHKFNNQNAKQTTVIRKFVYALKKSKHQ